MPEIATNRTWRPTYVNSTSVALGRSYLTEIPEQDSYSSTGSEYVKYKSFLTLGVVGPSQPTMQAELVENAFSNIRKYWATAFDSGRGSEVSRTVLSSDSSSRNAKSFANLAARIVIGAIGRRVPQVDDALKNRLVTLLELSDADLEGGARLRTESLLGLIGVLQGIGDIRLLPALSLTPTGTIYATWRDPSKRLSMNFLGSGRVSWVYFRPNIENNHIVDRDFGVTTTGQMVRKLRDLHVTWIANEG